jgi:hypothetical protein
MAQSIHAAGTRKGAGQPAAEAQCVAAKSAVLTGTEKTNKEKET